MYLFRRKGQTLGIVGKTGSGKTTIIKQLLREYPPGAGAITFTGVPIQEIPLEELRGWIGYVPQDHILFSKTVKENLLYGRQDANEEEIGGALKDAHFENDIGMLSDGLETLVGEKGVALSGGQKQRISIARALLTDPDILILDDSLSAVDAKTEAAIIDSIRKNGGIKQRLSPPTGSRQLNTQISFSSWMKAGCLKEARTGSYWSRTAGIENNMRGSSCPLLKKGTGA